MTLPGLAVRNVWRHKVRALLTVFGVALAVVTFMLLRTVAREWSHASGLQVRERVSTRNRTTFMLQIPQRYAAMVATEPALRPLVKKVTYVSWFGGSDPTHEEANFATYAVDTDTYFDVYDEFIVPKSEIRAWKEDKQGAIVGDLIAKQLKWKVGDRVSLISGAYPEESSWEFRIRGIYTLKGTREQRDGFLFHWDYLNDALSPERRGFVSFVVTRVTNGATAARAGAVIDAEFEDKDPQTHSDDEGAAARAAVAALGSVLRVLDIISLTILVSMTLIVGNTIAMAVRERTTEYGVLRAVGFLPRHVITFILAEATLVGGFGGVLGVAISYPLLGLALKRWLQENIPGIVTDFSLAWQTALTAIALASALGFVSAIIPAFRVSALRTIDALRRTA
jgi:putative ABC transport system permease protein